MFMRRKITRKHTHPGEMIKEMHMKPLKRLEAVQTQDHEN
jgi:plasmid maintenance system antidote protein VapI